MDFITSTVSNSQSVSVYTGSPSLSSHRGAHLMGYTTRE